MFLIILLIVLVRVLRSAWSVSESRVYRRVQKKNYCIWRRACYGYLVFGQLAWSGVRQGVTRLALGGEATATAATAAVLFIKPVAAPLSAYYHITL